MTDMEFKSESGDEDIEVRCKETGKFLGLADSGLFNEPKGELVLPEKLNFSTYKVSLYSATSVSAPRIFYEHRKLYWESPDNEIDIVVMTIADWNLFKNSR